MSALCHKRTHALQQLDGRRARAILWKCGSPAQLLCPLQVVALQRERADALAGCSKDRVAERRRHERWRRLANAAPESAARHDNALDFRRLGKTHHRIVVEVRLLDAPVLNSDL